MSALREIEIVRDRGHGVDVRARRSTRSNSNEGQRAATATEGGWVSATEKNLSFEGGFQFQLSGRPARSNSGEEQTAAAAKWVSATEKNLSFMV